MNAKLVRYLRDESGKPYGTVVAVDPDHIGWSLCHKESLWNPGDNFVKTKGVKIATNRAMLNLGIDKAPRAKQAVLAEAIAHMKVRANNYWKKNQLA